MKRKIHPSVTVDNHFISFDQVFEVLEKNRAALGRRPLDYDQALAYDSRFALISNIVHDLCCIRDHR